MNVPARLCLLALTLISVTLLSICIGPTGYDPKAWGAMVGLGSELSQVLVWEIRLPRVLLALTLGAGLGAAGAGYQGLFRNPLADPFVIGASSGAALGATLSIVLQWRYELQWYGLTLISMTTLSALVGSLATVWVVFTISKMGAKMPTVSLLLSGVAVSSFLGALVSLVMFVNEQKLSLIFGWLMGSLSSRGWADFQTSWPLILVGGGGLLWMARSLDVMVFGDEPAASLGIEIRRVRTLVVVFSSLATAAAVSGGGIIGFVGLIAPHIGRLTAGTARHGIAIPSAAFAGAILLVLSDDLARTVVAPGEIPVGVITALLGAPFFIVLLRGQLRP
jgi:iron complex transport system permease protein